MGARHHRARSIAALLVAGALSLPGAASAATGTAAATRASRGTLIVHVTGLPAGERPSISVRGPRHFRRTIRTAAPTKITGLRSGAYELRVRPVRLRTSHGTARRGATAAPLTATVAVAIASGARTSATAAYGTITNPGVRTLGGAVRNVAGPAESPTSIVVDGGTTLHRGDIVSSAPTTQLPRGLLSTVTGVSASGGQTTLTLTPASPFDVMPNADFDIPVDLSAAGARAGAECAGVLTGGMVPSIKLSAAHMQGSWNTVRVLGREIPIGLRLTLTFHAALTEAYERSIALSCTVSTHAVYVTGMAGPVPVYGTVDPTLGIEVKDGAKFSITGGVDITAGATTVGAPPALVWLPILTIGHPSLTSAAERLSETTLSAGLHSSLGIGEADVANVHIEAIDDLEYTARPDSCDVHLDLGKFNAGGKIATLEVKTPDTPPILGFQLFHGCAGTPGPAAPAPTPTSAATPVTPPPARGPTLVYQGDTTGSASSGDLDFSEFADATGESLDYATDLPAGLNAYRCVVLDLNDDFTADATARIGAYLAAGGTVLALGEHSGSRFSLANDALNGLASSVGATGLAINDDSWDDGDNYTGSLGSGPLLTGVTWIGDNWTSSLTVDPPASPLVYTAEDSEVPFIGAQPVGNGTFVMSGDSNVFSDNNRGLFASNDNGRFVANLCP